MSTALIPLYLLSLPSPSLWATRAKPPETAGGKIRAGNYERPRMMARLYNRRRWRRESRAYLTRNPLCVMCTAVGRTSLATVVDHIVPHRGDPELFWDEANNWQGLCKTDHDAAKKELEMSGRLRGCDVHGRPLDPNHPWNQQG